MGLLAQLGAISQVALLAAAASPRHIVTDPYLATQWNACPAVCDSANPADWTFYPNLKILKSCDEPMLLNLAVHNGASDTEGHQTLYACVASNETTFGDSDTKSYNSPNSPSYSTKSVQMETAWRGEDASEYLSHIEDSARAVQAQLHLPANQKTKLALGYSNGVAFGAYFGSMMDKSKNKSLFQSFLDKIHQGELNKSGSMMQVCDGNRSAAYSLGVVSEASRDPAEALASVKEALSTWSKGKCLQGYTESSLSRFSVGETEEQRSHDKRALSGNHQRDTCRDIQSEEGEGCPELAKRCGISPADFTKYNLDTDCSKMRGGHHVCCSAGTPPDYSPKPNADGTCHVYTVQHDDDCDGIAAANSISTDDIFDWNKKTWGWMGCGSNLQAGGNICLSKGEPPMPSVVKNAVCGPQKAGTKRPDDWDDIESLNPCPLNACCDAWGQCGTTDKFCTKTNSSTTAPGTAKPNTNGCISNCGTDIVYLDDGFPAGFDAPIMVGYYEAFQNTRNCLNLEVSAIENEISVGKSFALTWDHIHFAFANVTEDFDVDITNVEHEFTQFTKFSGQGKNPKVLSFGGWSFSTNLDSYAIFRKGVTDEQRSLFASNVVKFADEHALDGLDFDWEYPGAPDIPGIPKGDSDDGERYLQFLKEVREKLDDDKTLSIAAPSSFWYLKGFPIKKISDVVDYIVYMTYDIHGQWDWNSTDPDAMEGCDGHACLRSHVNFTETTNSLSMITKAGVPNSKIVAGIASYGRSFGMEDPKCHGPECKFTGPESGAMAGRCTDTKGYISNAEINEWLENSDVNTYFDNSSRSTISYSSDGTWVAYNTESERNDRIMEWYNDKTVLGTSLWAIDLTEFVVGLPNGQRLEPFEISTCGDSFDSLDDLEAATGIDEFCMNTYLMQALNGNLTASLKKYQDLLDDGYDDEFNWYKKAVEESAPNSLKDFLKNHADDYFECSCVPMSSTTRSPIDGADNSTSQCPYAPKEGGYQECWWDANDKDGFEEDVMTSAGISSDWLLYGYDGSHCERDLNNPMSGNFICSGSANRGNPTLKPGYTITNPKDTISDRLPSIKTLQDNLSFISMLSAENAYEGDTSDVVDGAALLTLMVSQSVTSMKQVAEVGEEYKDNWITEVVVLFVTALLMVIPGLGEVAEAEGMVAIATTLRVIGEAGDVGMTVYDIVSSKDEGPGAIFLALLGGLGSLDMIKAPELFGKAAKARRGMKDEHFATLGHEIKGGMGQVDKLIAACY
ncbi:class V chitinase [Penicillium angulare]|uniref:class V chitinase n=1 Tax=Penicillium angulare TaxID=116970 RepID=UPI00253FDA35|nr:class V chitinase [Penicillium angulare]KAJ5280182.1 class V chitinase [Penicillium angulare]